MTEEELSNREELWVQQVQDILEFVRQEGIINPDERFSADGTCRLCGWALSIERVDGKVYAKCSTPDCFEIRDL